MFENEQQNSITFLSIPYRPDNQCHKRRVKTEEKAKDIAYVWETEFIQFLAALACLQKDNFH